MANEAVEMEHIAAMTDEGQSEDVSNNDCSDFDSGDVSLEKLMSKEKPSLMMEAFEKGEFTNMYHLSDCFGKILKKAAQNDEQREIDKIVCHLMNETKYEADRLRADDVDDFDYVTEIFDEVYKHNEDAIEKALVNAATAADGVNGCSTKNEWPLLIAAGCGFKDCVRTLLKEEDLIIKTDLYGHNFLMRAIKGKHRDVVRTIFNNVDDDKIVDLMKTSVSWKRGILGATYETPLRWLIKMMPDMAKQFLDICVKKKKKGQKETTYNYDFIDDFEWVKEKHTTKADNDGSICTRIKEMLKSKHQRPSNHVLNFMIKHDTLKLLKHPLVTSWIQQKWKRTSLIYATFFILYLVFLAILTAYAVVSPIPALDSTCSNLSLAHMQNQDNSTSSSMTISTTCLMKYPYLFVGGIFVIILSILHIVIELQQIYQRGSDYFLDWENYLQFFVFSGAISFVSHFGFSCYCKTPSQWQLGALILFCGWFNIIVLLKNAPNIGAPINLLFRICYKYITLIYLPILLVISFALPFYMLFVNGPVNSSIKGFDASAWSLLTTFAATSGGLGYSDIFLNNPLLYLPASIVLFIIFVVIVSILFNNMLLGLAVGDASNALQEADLINIGCQVEYIILTEDAFSWSKVELEETDNSEQQQSSSCCKWLSVSKIYGRFFNTKESQHDDDDDDDDDNDDDDNGIEIMEELEELREEMEERNDDIAKELRKIFCILESIQQKVGP